MSSILTEDETAWFIDRYGLRMVRVQENADVPSRKQRRANVKASKKRKNGTRKS